MFYFWGSNYDDKIKWLRIGKMFNISDSSIRKWVKNMN